MIEGDCDLLEQVASHLDEDKSTTGIALNVCKPGVPLQTVAQVPIERVDNISYSASEGEAYDSFGSASAWFSVAGGEAYWDVVVKEVDGRWYVSQRSGPYPG